MPLKMTLSRLDDGDGAAAVVGAAAADAAACGGAPAAVESWRLADGPALAAREQQASDEDDDDDARAMERATDMWHRTEGAGCGLKGKGSSRRRSCLLSWRFAGGRAPISQPRPFLPLLSYTPLPLPPSPSLPQPWCVHSSGGLDRRCLAVSFRLADALALSPALAPSRPPYLARSPRPFLPSSVPAFLTPQP